MQQQTDLQIEIVENGFIVYTREEDVTHIGKTYVYNTANDLAEAVKGWACDVEENF